MMNKPLRIIPIFLQAIIYSFTLVLFKSFFHLKVTGLEHVLKLRSGIIFASNHISEWDGILVRVALPLFSGKFSPMYYVSRTREFYTNSSWRKVLYGGLLFKLLGAYPVYGGKKDYSYSLQHYLKLLQLKRNICIFPEGVRSMDGKLGEAHGGVAYLSHTTKTLVVPVGIRGVLRLTLSNFLKRDRAVEIIFGAPLLPEVVVPQPNPSLQDYKSGSTFIMSRVGELLA